MGTVKATNMVLLEGNYMDFNVPYFEGICDSKMPILRNVGKNLFNPSLLLESETRFGITKNVVGETIVLNGTSSQYHDLHFTPNDNKTGIVVKKGKFYKLTIHCLGGTSTPVLNPAVKLTLKDGTIKWLGSNIDLRDSSCDGLLTWFRICPQEGNSFNNYQIKLQLEESSTSTSYESYKTNILRTSEEIVLREVSGVQDTYNGLTGEYVKRIEECVLDGSQALSLDGSLVYLGLTDRPINNSGIADKVPVITVNQLLTGEFGICMQDRGTSGRIYINIEGLTTREEILQYLRTNPITVQYELVEPIITIIKPSTIPFAYANGHMVLESGSSEQSLLPHLKYSVVTGRTGQVTQNAKVLRQQENQITSLEDLLLTQIVQMDYERTLLQFDYELQMMMLG